MGLKIVEKDILTMSVDAIVNSTNINMKGYSGLDKIIHEKGGQEFEKECRNLICRPGEAVSTRAFNLDCKYIIHTVTLTWEDGFKGEPAIIKSCYRSSLELARELECKSIAFPLLSSGCNKVPISDALDYAVNAIEEYLFLFSDMQVYLVLYGDSAKQIAELKYDDLENYLNEKSKPESTRIYGKDYLKNYIGNIKGKTFRDIFDDFMRKKGIEKESDVYKAAGMRSTTFNGIKNNNNKPSFDSVVKLAIGLKLNLEEAKLLLSSAGYALSEGDLRHIIFSWAFETGKYNITLLNLRLDEYDCKIL